MYPWFSDGLGGQIHIHFLHYKDFNSALESWRKRTKRIHWDKIFFVLVERDGCTKKDLMDFCALAYKYKVALTHRAYDNLETFTITGFENDKELGNIMVDKGMLGKKYYDQFDWIRFFNQV